MPKLEKPVEPDCVIYLADSNRLK